MRSFERLIFAGTLASALVVSTGALLAAPKKVEVAPLAPEGQKAHDEYAGMLETLRGELDPKLPQIDAAKEAALMEAHGAKTPPFPRPPVFAKASTGRPVRPDGRYRSLPPKANSSSNAAKRK